METPDGQKLLWSRDHNKWKLFSLPSQTLLACYDMSSGVPQQTGQSQQELGRLDIFAMTISKPAELLFLDKHNRSNSHASTSSSTSSEGPRLGRSHQCLAIGLCAPAVISAGIASPHSSAGMNRLCMIGDELANLGRASIKKVVEVMQDTNRALTSNKNEWLDMNRAPSNRKSNDPRPRNVEADLVVSSLIAVLAG
jgi:hypothetical protein